MKFKVWVTIIALPCAIHMLACTDLIFYQIENEYAEKENLEVAGQLDTWTGPALAPLG